jgi:6-phosphogluconate dehydrogenase
MQIGVIGLGRMGGNIVRRLVKGGHTCVVYDRAQAAVDALAKEKGVTGVTGVADLRAFVAALQPPRAAWVMLPAGAVTDGCVKELGELMAAGDTIIDGGNSFWRDDIRHAEALAPKKITYLDVGTSGGVWGLERGYCLMIGGDKAAFDRIEPIFATLAPGMGTVDRTPNRKGAASAEQGYLHVGPVGSGHFVKMVHNGIEYGLMQAFAEGFDILKHAASSSLPPERRLTLDVGDIAEVWRRGSVVSSWLLDLVAAALTQDRDLAGFSPDVEDSGEGRWTIEAALEEAVPATVLTAALYERFRSRDHVNFSDRLLSAMRKGFGGHVPTGQKG